jgi:hypothetical protein
MYTFSSSQFLAPNQSWPDFLYSGRILDMLIKSRETKINHRSSCELPAFLLRVLFVKEGRIKNNYNT